MKALLLPLAVAFTAAASAQEIAVRAPLNVTPEAERELARIAEPGEYPIAAEETPAAVAMAVCGRLSATYLSLLSRANPGMDLFAPAPIASTLRAPACFVTRPAGVAFALPGETLYSLSARVLAEPDATYFPEFIRHNRYALQQSGWDSHSPLTWGQLVLPTDVPFSVPYRAETAIYRLAASTSKLADPAAALIAAMPGSVVDTDDLHLESNVPVAPLVAYQCARTGYATDRGWPFNAGEVAEVIARNAAFRAKRGLEPARPATVAIVDDGLDAWGSGHFPLEAFARNGDVAGGGDSDQNDVIDDDIGTNIFVGGEPRAYYDPQNGMDSDHGTRMAGLALGGPGFREAAAQRGIDPLVRLLIVSIVKKEQTASSLNYRMPPQGLYDALGYVKGRSARVANLSVTTSYRLSTLPTLTSGYKDMLLVVAAGNHRHNYNDRSLYPGSFGGGRGTLSSQVLTVAAHGKDGCLTSFSGYGDDAVDIAAPGVDISTTVRGGVVASSEGTSQATALVSFVATHLSAAGVSSPLKIKERLRASVDLDPALSRQVFFGGTLNIPKALSVYHDVVETNGGKLRFGRVASPPSLACEGIETWDTILKISRDPGGAPYPAVKVLLRKRNQVVESFDCDLSGADSISFTEADGGSPIPWSMVVDFVPRFFSDAD